jgi:hypothetical protein
MFNVHLFYHTALDLNSYDEKDTGTIFKNEFDWHVVSA